MHFHHVVIIATLLGVTSIHAHAATTVNDLGDTGPGNCATTCTLRDAIATAASGDIINFAANLLPGTITLTQGQLSIGKSLTIAGPGAAQLAISANASSRVLTLSAGTVGIIGVTLRDGRVSGANGSGGPSGSGSSGQYGVSAVGGCINVAASVSLILDRADIRNCVAQGGNGGSGGSGAGGLTGGDGGGGGFGANGRGGAIYSAGALTLLNSSLINGGAYGGVAGSGGNGGNGTFSDGKGGSGGNGGTANGGAVYVATGGSLFVNNATIAGSVAIAGRGGNGGSSGTKSGGAGGNGGNGAGGLIEVATSVTPADLEFSTLTNGSATAGLGGIGGSGSPYGFSGLAGTRQGNAISAASTLTSLSSIIVGVGATPLCTNNVVAAAGSANLDQDSSCTGFTLHGTFAQLFRPLDLATSWPAYVPAYKSVIIDAAATCNDLTAQPVASDQHGTPRPQGSKCDIGAIETDYIFFDGFE